MKIVIMHQTIVKHDAIGNDIEQMYQILNQKHKCWVFANNMLNDRLNNIEVDMLEEILQDRNSLIIYHHSVFWEFGEQLIKQCKGKLIIRYHNITPSQYFAPYNDFHEKQCALGRKQTKRFIEEFPDAVWMMASKYNAFDAAALAKEKITVCPPFNQIEKWSQGIPDENILKELIHSNNINLLFVGRIAPNKGHLFLLDILKSYCVNYNNNIILRIVGKFDEGLNEYNQLIQNKIIEYQLEENVQFIGEINDSSLISYYLGSDFFLCASEHEGFCVPLIEAQFFMLPILARNSSAIPETLGKNQIVLEDNPKEYASAIHILFNNKKYCNYLKQNGLKNFHERFTYENIFNSFKNVLLDTMGVEI